jgi:hypothetical protein
MNQEMILCKAMTKIFVLKKVCDCTSVVQQPSLFDCDALKIYKKKKQIYGNKYVTPFRSLQDFSSALLSSG